MRTERWCRIATATERPADWWPSTAAELEVVQLWLAERASRVPAWTPAGLAAPRVGGVFAATPRHQAGPGAAGDAAFVAAVILDAAGLRVLDAASLEERFDAGYAPGLLGLREGRVLERAVRALRSQPDVLLVNATGRDHPRGAGLALHLGAACDVPTIGVTDRALIARGPEPADVRGASAELRWNDATVGYRLRTRQGSRAVVVHAAWRVDAATARGVVLAVTASSRTPAPLREARRLARTSRAGLRG